MRAELFYNPLLFMERIGQWAVQKQRLRKLRGTVASQLTTGHIDSLELLELLRPMNPQVIYDIGANVGTWTLLAKAVFPSAMVHAFEPLESHWGEFAERTRSLSRVNLHRIALGSETGQLQMRVPDHSDAASLLPMTEACQKQYALKPEKVTTVTVERLDEFARREHLPAPDLLKLDIQGYELEALRGATQIMAGASAVLTEVSFIELYKGQCLFHELVTFLAEHGFNVCAFGVQTTLGRPLLQADVLFVSEQAASKLKTI